MVRRNLCGHPSHLQVHHCRAFSHPDCTVGAGISPAQPSPLFILGDRSRAFTAGRGIAPRPEGPMPSVSTRNAAAGSREITPQVGTFDASNWQAWKPISESFTFKGFHAIQRGYATVGRAWRPVESLVVCRHL